MTNLYRLPIESSYELKLKSSTEST